MSEDIKELKNQMDDCSNFIASLRKEIDAKMKDKNGSGVESLKASSHANNIKTLNNHKIKNRRALKGHFLKVYAINWCRSPSYADYIVSASQDSKLIVWNTFLSSKVKIVHLRYSWVMTVSYSPSGKFISCGGLDNIVSLFPALSDPSIGRQHKEKFSTATKELSGHEGYISSIKWLSENELVSSSGDTTVRLFDVETQQTKRVFQGHTQDVMSCAVWGENVIVSGSVDSTARWWDSRQDKCVQVYIGHESDINSVCVFPDGAAFATASDDSSCRLFDSRCLDQMNIYSGENILCGLTSISFSHSGRILIAGYDDFNIRLWDTIHAVPVEPGNLSQTNRISCVDIQPNGQALGSGSWDSTINIWA